MASERDDMVLRPRLGSGGPTVRERAAQERQIAAAQRTRHGLLRRLGMGRAAMAEAEGELEIGPMMGRAAAVAAAAAVALRIATGRTFENMGQQALDATIGGLSDDAAASKLTRMSMRNDDRLMQMYRVPGVAGQAKQVFDVMKKSNLREVQGHRGFMADKAYQVNGMLDMLVEKMVDEFKDAANAWTTIKTIR